MLFPELISISQPAWEAYSQTETKRPLTVAVIDTGVDISHPDLQGSIWVNEDEIPGDGIDNDGNGYVDDVNGWNFVSNSNEICTGEEDSHGTHGAGTIAATWNNGGIAGITDNTHVKLMVLKALGGSDGKGSPESVIEAMKYAEANGADICNLSFGSGNCTPEFEAAIRDFKVQIEDIRSIQNTGPELQQSKVMGSRRKPDMLAAVAIGPFGLWGANMMW